MHRVVCCRNPVTVIIAVGLLSCVVALASAAAGRAAAKPEWRLAVQAWTFNDVTFFEAIEKAKAAGVKFIEAFPGQKLSKEDGNAAFDHGMSKELREKAKARLEKEGIKLVNYGVVDLGRDEASDRKVFDFAKDMGIETIVSEPEPAALPLIDKLAEEYKVNVALHNHPKPSRYWNPDTVLEAVKGRSKRIGACADTGHWMRSGIVPLEAVKKLEGRIVSSHLKDLNEFGNPGAHDVVWGTGKGDVKAVLEELERQGFKGVFSIEYEYNWGKSLPDVTACARFFEKATEELSR